MQSDFWVECLIETLHIPFENSQVMYLYWLKVKLQIYQKIDDFFGNLETYSQIPILKQKEGLQVFHCSQDCFAKASKCIK